MRPLDTSCPQTAMAINYMSNMSMLASLNTERIPQNKPSSLYLAVNNDVTYLDRNPHKSLNSVPSDIMLRSVTFFRMVSPSCTSKHARNLNVQFFVRSTLVITNYDFFPNGSFFSSW